MLITESKTSEHANKCSGCQPKEESQTSQSVPKGPPLVSQLENPTVTQTSRILASLVLESEQLLRAPLYDDDDIDHDKTPIFYPSYTSLVMRIYNLDYVLSVQNFWIFLVTIFLKSLLISLHSFWLWIISSGRWASIELLQELNQLWNRLRYSKPYRHWSVKVSWRNLSHHTIVKFWWFQNQMVHYTCALIIERSLGYSR